MSFCPYCGKELTPEEGSAKFCAYCGKPLDAEATVTEDTPVSETPVSNETPAGNPGIDTNAIKENAMTAQNKFADFCNNIVEKLKSVPALAKLFEKIDKKFYPAVLAAPIAVVLLVFILVIGIFSAGSHMSPLNDFLNQVNRKTANEEKLQAPLMADFRYNLLKKTANIAKKIDSYQENIENTNENLEAKFDELDD